ncbi:MAG: dTMP kinase [Metamycoplasmataceae bacterium]
MFITFEGLDNSGKTTAIKKLFEYLKENNMESNFVFTREPGGNGLKEAEFIREFVLSPEYDIDPMSEALLYLVSRRMHLTKIIEPAIKEGKIVICDRFIDSSLAYQGAGRNLGIDKIRRLNEIVTDKKRPDLTFFIKVSAKESRNRLSKQKTTLDRLEKNEIEFYERIANGYDQVINNDKKRFIIIDGSLSIEEIGNQVINEFKKFMKNKNDYKSWKNIINFKK